MSILVIAMLLGGAAVGAGATEHRARVDHASGSVDVHYRATLAVTHRQLGAVVPGGRTETLRCGWSADMAVERRARHAAGGTLARRLHRSDVLSGSRPGWCDTHRAGIAREVAGRHERVRAHLLALAADDRAALHAELDHHKDHAG